MSTNAIGLYDIRFAPLYASEVAESAAPTWWAKFEYKGTHDADQERSDFFRDYWQLWKGLCPIDDPDFETAKRYREEKMPYLESAVFVNKLQSDLVSKVFIQKLESSELKIVFQLPVKNFCIKDMTLYNYFDNLIKSERKANSRSDLQYPRLEEDFSGDDARLVIEGRNSVEIVVKNLVAHDQLDSSVLNLIRSVSFTQYFKEQKIKGLLF